ncbi:MAG: hypothetical protein ACRDTA_06840 [Pseudonocardiaceae bacterium]
MPISIETTGPSANVDPLILIGPTVLGDLYYVPPGEFATNRR